MNKREWKIKDEDVKVHATINPPQIETATLGMGCFWSPEALFGHLPGVIRTRVGYAGGTTPDPTYRNMGDHSETVQFDYDPARITFEEILRVFWQHHNPVNINDYKGRQYMSLVLCMNESQKTAADRVAKEIVESGRARPETEVASCISWHLAEDRHQKYYLHRYPSAVAKLGMLYPDRHELLNSTLAARLNGLAKGYTNMERIRQEITSEWPLSQAEKGELLGLLSEIRW
ncbi:peptide-methionine (S)-S-oxide reductase MsrA [Paenibacillus tuaregi]|uniref:peptide-methionine (S)-S-oxide reductase MsrA n=1 Tax=Paenibacillus tuaregi TaxID=1816681 RepID=UPI000A7D7517|nr:peptide-methionine (S)-S-oxide reductase [Paenibacillus tuaregi]